MREAFVNYHEMLNPFLRSSVDRHGRGRPHGFQNSLTARGARIAALNPQHRPASRFFHTEDADSWTGTLDHPTLGHAVVVLNKGMASTGGAFGYSATGTPDLAPLRDSVQPITVTNDGPVWG
jgi:hypothetical protein